MRKYFLRSCVAILLSIFLLADNCWAGITFDKIDDVVNCGTSDTLLTENGAITISAWINPTNTGEGGFGRIIDRSATIGGPCWQLFATATSGFEVDGTTNLLRKSSNNSLTLNIWQHILLTWDGSTTASNVHIYVNGIETTYQTTTNGVNIVNNAGESFLIGNDKSNGRTFNGQITELAVWNVVLTASQIALLASSFLKSMPLQLLDPDADGVQELVGYWPMDEGTHSNSADLDTAWDKSNNGNNGNPDNGVNNTGLTWAAETILNCPSPIIWAN